MVNTSTWIDMKNWIYQYRDKFDNIKGILYIKDILPQSHKGGSFKWESLIRQPFYVPEKKKINSKSKIY